MSGVEPRRMLAAAAAGSSGGSSAAWPCALEGQYQYPKLQLVHIDDAWYALNQSCLQIYQMLQQSGRAQLMPVDIVPLHKVNTLTASCTIPLTAALLVLKPFMPSCHFFIIPAVILLYSSIPPSLMSASCLARVLVYTPIRSNTLTK